MVDFVFKLKKKKKQNSVCMPIFKTTLRTHILLRESLVIVLMVIACLGQLTSSVIFLKVRSEGQGLERGREGF